MRTAGRGVSFFYRRGEAVRAAEKNLGQHCARRPRFMAKEVGAVMIVWELWSGTVTREASMERDEMIFVVGASMRMLITGGNECTNVRQEYKIVCLVIM